MSVEIDLKNRIFIVEGIAGSGKNTLIQQLKQKLSNKQIYDYSEEELLFSWKHAWIPNIDELRLIFLKTFLDYCEQILSDKSDSVFILNRFHITYKIFQSINNDENNDRYNLILEKLKKLQAVVLVLVIDDKLIESRSVHSERTDPIWQIHLKKRLKQKGYKTLTELYSQEQKNIISLLKEQGLAYQLMNIENNIK